jgi:hypothetical protein
MDVLNILAIIVVLFTIWLCFEAWRAPLMRENADGSWTTIKPQRKLFKKQKSKTAGSYEDLEKLRRGRSKH